MIDIFDMKHYADNAVNCHTMKVGIKNLNAQEFEIALIENGNLNGKVRLLSADARRKMIDALEEEIRHAERQMSLISAGEKPDEIENIDTSIDGEIPF